MEAHGNISAADCQGAGALETEIGEITINWLLLRGCEYVFVYCCSSGTLISYHCPQERIVRPATRTIIFRHSKKLELHRCWIWSSCDVLKKVVLSTEDGQHIKESRDQVALLDISAIVTNFTLSASYLCILHLRRFTSYRKKWPCGKYQPVKRRA